MSVERLHRIVQLIRRRGRVTMLQLTTELEVSAATIKRDLDFLKDRLHCPLEYDRSVRGYVIRDKDAKAPFELPGLWFSAAEIHSLLAVQHLLSDLHPTLFAPYLKPLQARLDELLGGSNVSAKEIRNRVKLISFSPRHVDSSVFERVTTALFQRRRLRIAYFHRERKEISERTISPLQLLHYRDNWLLDSWCHKKNGLRTFALDAIQELDVLDSVAVEVDKQGLERHFEGGYGIYSGEARHVAKLQFSADRAQWISTELWHPQQRGSWQSDKSYILEVPYSKDPELLMEILKYGADVEVLAPPELRRSVARALRAAVAVYGQEPH